jgi:hypothetical protein
MAGRRGYKETTASTQRIKAKGDCRDFIFLEEIVEDIVMTDSLLYS